MSEQDEIGPKKSNAKRLQFNVKIGDPELHKELTELVDKNGEFTDREDWIRYAVQVMKLQDQKVAAQKYGQELRDFENHTKRLNEIFINFVSRVMFEEEESATKLSDTHQQVEALQARVLSLSEQLDEKEEKMDEQKEKHQAELQENKQLHDERKKHLEDRIEELQRELSKSDAFTEQQAQSIAEYQKRIMEKDEELSRSKGLQKENEELKESIYKQREKFTSALDEMKDTLSDKEKDIQSLTDRINAIQLEKDREILKIKMETQEQLAKANEDYNARVRELLNELHKQKEKE